MTSPFEKKLRLERKRLVACVCVVENTLTKLCPGFHTARRLTSGYSAQTEFETPARKLRPRCASCNSKYRCCYYYYCGGNNYDEDSPGKETREAGVSPTPIEAVRVVAVAISVSSSDLYARYVRLSPPQTSNLSSFDGAGPFYQIAEEQF